MERKRLDMSGTPAEFFDKLSKVAESDPEAATASDAIFQFDLAGEGGGTWVLNLKKGTTSDFVSTEANPDAGATIHVDAADWVAMVNGELDPMQAFMGGKIRIDGDMSLAMNLQSVMQLAQG